MATESQYMRYSRRKWPSDSPVSSGPPTSCEKCSYGPTRCKHWCGKLRIECLNDKKSAKLDMIKTAHLEHASTVQPHGSTSNWVHGVYGPSHPYGRLEIEAIKVNSVQNSEMTHLWHAYAVQPPNNALRQCNGVIGPIRQCKTIKFTPTNISQTQWHETAHLECTSTAQPHRKALSHVHGVNRPSHQHGRPEIRWINVSQAQNGKMTYLQHADVMQPLEISIAMAWLFLVLAWFSCTE